MRITTRYAGDVLIVVPVGIMTAEARRRVMEACDEALVVRDARALVVDLRGAISVMTPEQWHDERAGYDETAVLHAVPVAYVVSEAVLVPVRQRCLRLAILCGMVRAAFTELSDGLSWAADRRDWWPNPTVFGSTLQRRRAALEHRRETC